MSESNRKKNKLCEDKDDEKGKQSETSSCQMDIEIVLGGETSFNNDQKNEEVKKIRGIAQDTGENLFNFPEGDKYMLRKRKIPNMSIVIIAEIHVIKIIINALLLLVIKFIATIALKTIILM